MATNTDVRPNRLPHIAEHPLWCYGKVSKKSSKKTKLISLNEIPIRCLVIGIQKEIKPLALPKTRHLAEM